MARSKAASTTVTKGRAEPRREEERERPQFTAEFKLEKQPITYVG